MHECIRTRDRQSALSYRFSQLTLTTFESPVSTELDCAYTSSSIGEIWLPKQSGQKLYCTLPGILLSFPRHDYKQSPTQSSALHHAYSPYSPCRALVPDPQLRRHAYTSSTGRKLERLQANPTICTRGCRSATFLHPFHWPASHRISLPYLPNGSMASTGLPVVLAAAAHRRRH